MCLETWKWQNPLLKQNRPEQGGTERMESVWKQENDKILCWSKTVTYRGAPNDLLKKEKDTFTPAQGEVHDIFTEVASFVKWIDAGALSMGGLQACEFLEKYHHCTTMHLKGLIII